jgi:outer membrane protein assembly factor BamB
VSSPAPTPLPAQTPTSGGSPAATATRRPAIPPTNTPRRTSTPTPTATATVRPTAQVAQAPWLYPRANALNSSVTELKGRFTTRPRVLWTFKPPAGQLLPAYLVAGDLAGQARLEVVVAASGLDPYDNYIYSIHSENGSLHWLAAVAFIVRWAPPILIDLDGDALLDIVVGASGGEGRVWALDGQAGYTLWQTALRSATTGMTAGDFDQDGVVDVFATDYSATRIAQLLDGRSGVQRWQRDLTGTNYNIPLALDLDGDGRQELVFSAHDPGRYRERFYALRLDGSSLWEQGSMPTGAQLAQARPETGHITEFGYTSALAADFDGDGALDIGVGTDLNYYVFRADGRKLWQAPTGMSGGDVIFRVDENGQRTVTDTHYKVTDAAAADLNGDGWPDVVFGIGSNFDESQVLAGGRVISRTITNLVAHNTVVALDGRDGRQLWSFTSTDYPVPEWGGAMSDPVIADVNGDGQEDVLVVSNDKHLYALDGGSGAKLWDWTNGNEFRKSLIFVDADGDGWGDILTVVGNELIALTPYTTGLWDHDPPEH